MTSQYYIATLALLSLQNTAWSQSTDSLQNTSVIIEVNESKDLKELGASVIHSKSLGDDLKTQTLEGKAWLKEMQSSLGESLKNQPMISVRSMGPAPARPIIRGLGNERVQIRESGHSVTDLSATSPDHAISLETARIKKIEILRGPKLLLSQASAMGASVEIETGLIPIDPFEDFDEFETSSNESNKSAALHSKSEFQSSFESVNLGWMTRLGSEIQYKQNRTIVSGSLRQAGNTQTPQGIIKNTQFKNQDFALGNSTQWQHWTLGFSLSEFSSDYGIPGGFLGGHLTGVDIELLRRNYSSLIHYHAHNDSKWLQQLNLSYDRSYFHQIETENAQVGAEFANWNHEVQAKMDHKGFHFWSGGSSSIGYFEKSSEVGGYVFTPPTQMKKTHLAILENFAFNDFHLEYSQRTEKTQFIPKQVAFLKTNPNREFLSFSTAIQPHFHINQFEWLAIIAKNESAPSLEQLYNQGPHLAAYSYETGNNQLSTESGMSYETEMNYQYLGFKLKAASFYYDFERFLEMAPTGEYRSQDGSNLPIYNVRAIPAFIYGGELALEQKLSARWSLISHLNRTLGEHKNPITALSQTRYLSSMPAFKESITLQYKYKTLDLQWVAQHFHSQYRVSEFESPTASAWVYNTNLGYGFAWLNTWNTLSLSLENLSNATYRNHLSRIRSISPEKGFHLRTNYKMEF